MALSSFLPLLLLLFSSTSNSAVHHHHHKSSPNTPTPTPTPLTPSNSPQTDTLILQACNATRFPSLCLSSLRSPNTNPTPLDLALAAFSAAAAAIPAAQSAAQSILSSSSSNLNRSGAARNCLEFLSLSSRRLSAASQQLPQSLPNARIWSSAALLYQYDCWSAYKYVNDSQFISDSMAYLVNLTALTSNAASMVAALQRYGPDPARWTPPQTERDGYWPDPVGSGSGSGSGTGHGGVPSGLDPNATVCKAGCGFGTVQEAVRAAPDYGTGRFVVYIKEGVYEETVRVPFEKTNLVFVGDGMGRTVITGSLNADTVGISTYNTATVGVLGDGFMARDLTFANTAGPDAHQAVAFRSDSDLSVLESVEFLGHQDTLYAHSLRQFYKSCRISGTVDFIFGNSATFFQDCLIFVLPRQLKPEHGEANTVTAHGRTDPAQSTGFVFDRCVVNGSEEYLALYRQKPAVHRVYLGRPWKEYSRTVFVDCFMAEIVRSEGWLPWNGDFALKTLFYGEHGNTGPGGDVSQRVSWSSQIPAEHLAVYSVDNFIQGNQWIPTEQ
ncbi:probable pectinesterase/pectinesterase inhibitor 51 [Typha angustifolia]|uniref:probable pectinesterase/pectinesterase inhibitor 51 n=1 Tax=Typha angustifolia TaxID=59011 RepID=UPI003C2C1CDA